MNDPAQDPSDRKDAAFVIITAALVTLVIVLLGVLTLRMRARAIRAERRVVALHIVPWIKARGGVVAGL